MDENDLKRYDFFISKTMFNLIALFGFLIIFITGMYWGYTFKENEQYFNKSVSEIKIVTYINEKYTYNFIPDNNKKYGDQLATRITIISLILITLGIVLLEIGYRNSTKYKHDKPFRQRIKEFYFRIKNMRSE